MPPLISQASNEALLPLVTTLGCLQVGGLVNAVLFGINCVKAFTYIHQSLASNDSSTKVKIKIVSLVWLINTLHVVFSVVTLSNYSENGMMHPEELLICHWSLATQTLLVSLGNSIIRSFFVRRLYKFSKKSCMNIVSDRTRTGMTIIATLLCVTSFAFGITLSAEQFIHKPFTDIEQRPYLVYLPLAFASTTDIFMCSCLCLFFRRIFQISKSGDRIQSIWENTNSLLKKVTFYRVSEGLLTTCANISCIIIFAVFPGRPIYLTIFSITSKLYFFSFLATLNVGTNDKIKERPRTLSSTTSRRQQSLAARTMQSALRSGRQSSGSHIGELAIKVQIDRLVTTDDSDSKLDTASQNSEAKTSDVAT